MICPKSSEFAIFLTNSDQNSFKKMSSLNFKNNEMKINKKSRL